MNTAELSGFHVNADWLYHYTKPHVAIEHVLGKQKIRFNSLNKTDDPLEFEDFLVSVGADTSTPREEVDVLLDEAVKLVHNVKSVCKLSCFSIDLPSNKSAYNAIFDKGFCLPRMWSQYGAKHYGVCLVFSRDRLIKMIESDTSAFPLPNGEHFSVFRNKVTYDNELFDLQNALTIDHEKAKGKTAVELMEQNATALLFTKFLNYSHEQEYRIVLYSDHFKTADFVDISFGDALEGIVLGTRFRKRNLPRIKILARELEVPLFKIYWYNGRPSVVGVGTSR